MTLNNADFTFTPSCETFLDLIDEPEEVYPDDKTILCSNRMKDINFFDVIWPKKQYNGNLYKYYGTVVAHLDTGAKGTVTNLKYILHNHKPYTKSFKCPVQLIGAVDRFNAIYSGGKGYLSIPADVDNGYIDVKCYYSPRLTSTLLSENCILEQNNNPSDYSSQTLQKHFAINDDSLLWHISQTDPLSSKPILYDYKNGTFTFTCHHKKTKSCNIVFHGSIQSGQCYTQPL